MGRATHEDEGALGAHFDAEVDAFLILVLSVYVARSAGAWVLAIGAARYAFLAAGWPLPWMREPLPPRHWRKVVAATQGIVLTIAAADVLPPAVTAGRARRRARPARESFGRDVWWLRRHRPPAPPAADDGCRPRHHRARVPAADACDRFAAALTVLAVLLVWSALVAPDQPIHLTPERVPEGPARGPRPDRAWPLVLPARGRRVLAWVVGPVLALVVILKILNIGFFAAFDRPFDPYQDVSYAGIGSETLRDVDRCVRRATMVLIGLGVLIVALLVLMTLAVRRV